MFFESRNAGYWNLLTVTNYRRGERDGTLHLVFPLPAGGNVKVKTDHPQYRQIDAYLRERTLGHDPS